MQKPAEHRAKKRPTLAEGCTTGSPTPAGRVCRQQGAAPGSGHWAPVPAQPPTSDGPLPLPLGGLSFPAGKKEDPEAVSRGSRRRGSRQHLQEDFLLGQERQVLEGGTGLRISRRPEAAPALPPAPGRRSRAHARAQAPRGPVSRAPGILPATPWTDGCPSSPSPRRAQSSANSSRDAGNFLTSALLPRHRPVPSATACGATAPGPAPSLKLLGVPSGFRL